MRSTGAPGKGTNHQIGHSARMDKKVRTQRPMALTVQPAEQH